MSLIKQVIGVRCDTEDCLSSHQFIDKENRLIEIQSLGWSIVGSVIKTLYYCPKHTKEREEKERDAN